MTRWAAVLGLVVALGGCGGRDRGGADSGPPRDAAADASFDAGVDGATVDASGGSSCVTDGCSFGVCCELGGGEYGCRDIASDPDHCNFCGNECAAGEVCVAALCEAP